MPKIINFPNNSDSVEDFMQKTKEFFLENNMTSITMIAKSKEGHIATGYLACDFGTMLELCGHLQVDIMRKMINENYVIPGGRS